MSLELPSLRSLSLPFLLGSACGGGDAPVEVDGDGRKRGTFSFTTDDTETGGAPMVICNGMECVDANKGERRGARIVA